MSNKEDVLVSSNQEQFDGLVEQANDAFNKLFSGKIILDPRKEYLLRLKKNISKAISLNYTYNQIAKLINDNVENVKFSAKQIKDFCEEQNIVKKDKNTKRKTKSALGTSLENLIEKHSENSEENAEKIDDQLTPKTHLNNQNVAPI